MTRLYVLAWVLAVAGGVVFAGFWSAGDLRVAGLAAVVSMVGVLAIGYRHSDARAGRS